MGTQTRPKSDKATRTGVLESLEAAKRHALPCLEAADTEASSALRVATDAVSGEVSPPSEAELNAELAAFDAAMAREGFSRDVGSSAWMLRTAVVAALFVVAGHLDEAQKGAAKVRRVAREKEAREDARARERELSAYQEAFGALRRGEQPLKLSVGEGDNLVEVELLGAHRACGGVVLLGSAPGTPMFATDWMATASRHPDAHVRDLAHRVERASVAALEAR